MVTMAKSSLAILESILVGLINVFSVYFQQPPFKYFCEITLNFQVSVIGI